MKVFEVNNKDNNSSSVVEFFVENGFCVVRGLYDAAKVRTLHEFVCDNMEYYSSTLGKKVLDDDPQAFAIGAYKEFQKTELYPYFLRNQGLLQILKRFLGNDICEINRSRFMINYRLGEKPKQQQAVEKKYQQLKNIHNDYWTGTSEYSLHYWMPFSGVDTKNTIVFYPGSHLNGIFPVANREIDKSIDFLYEPHHLDYLVEGDVVFFHALTLHNSMGKSEKTRMALVGVFASLNYPMTNQEKDLGYTTFEVGPMRKIVRLIGNDSLTPFRTYGGVPGIDRAVSSIYVSEQQDSVRENAIRILSNKN